MTYYGSPTAISMRIVLDGAGWRVKQRDHRKIWYKGRDGCQLAARNMLEAYNMEMTLRHTCKPRFMWGLEIAELLGSARPAQEETDAHTD
jgi:hypothetical protein